MGFVFFFHFSFFSKGIEKELRANEYFILDPFYTRIPLRFRKKKLFCRCKTDFWIDGIEPLSCESKFQSFSTLPNLHRLLWCVGPVIKARLLQLGRAQLYNSQVYKNKLFFGFLLAFRPSLPHYLNALSFPFPGTENFRILQCFRFNFRKICAFHTSLRGRPVNTIIGR